MWGNLQTRNDQVVQLSGLDGLIHVVNDMHDAMDHMVQTRLVESALTHLTSTQHSSTLNCSACVRQGCVSGRCSGFVARLRRVDLRVVKCGTVKG